MQAQRSGLHFSLDIAGKGQVEGVLWYFPFENETESLPVEDFNLVHNAISTYNMTQQPLQAMTQMHATQAGHQTQQPGKGKEHLGSSASLLDYTVLCAKA